VSERDGFTLWFTGLSGSGKTTIAEIVGPELERRGHLTEYLDGDVVRTHLSKGLGFSKEDRDANINRVGYVAGLVAQHGGTTLCSVISPYRGPRDNARKFSRGNFVEVYCDTPIEVCERRDVKGLYAKARAGQIQGFTGVDDPYEPPLNPEVTLDTNTLSVQECVHRIIDKLLELGYILPHGHI
jgi:sulfate adenylyltransferase